MLGGRAAEEVMYGQDTSTLSAQHLPDASWLARKMVSMYVLATSSSLVLPAKEVALRPRFRYWMDLFSVAADSQKSFLWR